MFGSQKFAYSSGLDITLHIKAMCHTDVVAPIVTNRFPYFRRTSSFIDSKQSELLFS